MTKKQRRKLNELDRKFGLPKGTSFTTVKEMIKYSIQKPTMENSKWQTQ